MPLARARRSARSPTKRISSPSPRSPLPVCRMKQDLRSAIEKVILHDPARMGRCFPSSVDHRATRFSVRDGQEPFASQGSSLESPRSISPAGDRGDCPTAATRPELPLDRPAVNVRSETVAGLAKARTATIGPVPRGRRGRVRDLPVYELMLEGRMHAQLVSSEGPVEPRVSPTIRTCT